MSDIILSICTATRNRLESLTRLAAALHTIPVPWQWVVAESNDVPMNGQLPSAEIIRVMPPNGATRGLNLAFRAAVGRYVMLLSDDTIPYPFTISTALAYMEAHPTIAQGAFYVHGTNQPCHVPMERGYPYAQYWIVRRLIGEEVGWYDPTLTHYGVDYDFSCRLLSKGYGVAAIPGACLFDWRPQDATLQAHDAIARQEGQRAADRWHPSEEALKRQWQSTWAKDSGPYDCPKSTHG